MTGAPLLLPLPCFLALLMGGAHFWRAGLFGVAAVCGLLAALAWTRQAWVRPLLLAVLPLLAARWIWITGQYVQLRQFLELPRHRLTVILLGVALFTALAALPLSGGQARRHYCRKKEAASAQLGALLLCLALLLPLWIVQPRLLALERFLPQGGLVQTALAGLWAALVAGWLYGAAAPRARMRLWRLFSLVFFGQLVLGLLVDNRFLFSGNLHLPVPGLIIAAPLYRGGGWFMAGLFAVSTLLVGAAWCSHLCYFGVWDATAATAGPAAPPGTKPQAAGAPPSTAAGRAPAWLPRARLAMLALTLCVPAALRAFGAPVSAALACGLLLGLALVPCAAFISRRAGYPAYCRGLCPLGLLAVWLGRLAPWRVRLTGDCISCMACVRVCRQDAMTPQTLAQGAPDRRCHLCRDCIAVCPQQALSVTFYGSRYGARRAGAILAALLAGLHAAFLAVARI